MSDCLPPLPIQSGQGPYEVQFPKSVRDVVASALALPAVIVVADRNVARLHAEQLAPLIENRPCLLVEASEEKKTPAGVLEAWEFFLAAKATRQTNVVVLGGGIVQDLSQFAAHNFHRGLAWHYIPTTLLGMADSCIGAKCGINLGSYKNQLGVFHSPASVLVCEAFLSTLSDTDIRSGYGEILKLHLTRSGPELFHDLKRRVEPQGLRNEWLPHLIRQSLEVKKSVIEEDEYEKDVRRILNYGHTFGHALEAITHHAIPHGIAVAWGIDLVNFIAWRTGHIAAGHFEEVHSFILQHFSWPLKQPVLALDLIDATRRDKKNRDGLLTLILPDSLGTLAIAQRSYDTELSDFVTEYLRSFNVCTCA
jgi:3-dehydroquinate synthase